ncbi:MAG: TolB family protein, partial [Chloroflexota bacterium]
GRGGEATALSRRAFCAAVAVSATVAACSAPGPGASSAATGPLRPPAGKLVLARNSKFLTFDLATKAQSPLGSFPSGAFASSPAVSPDRKQLAYTLYVVPADKNDLGGNDLYVMDATGANPRVIRNHGQAGGSFEDPAWSSDGRALLATLRAPLIVAGQTVGETANVVRVPLAGSGQSPIASGQSPATSPDGKLIAYLVVDKQATVHLWTAAADGSDPRELLAGQGFTNFRGPRFSPDSQTIVVAGQGGPARSTARRPTRPSPLVAWLGPGIAEADGIPMDVWTLKPDGGNLRQITHALDHSPTPAWSPDGTWVAVGGELYLTLVNATSGQTLKLLDNASLSGLTWLT